ncbi:hypothetical protein [Alteromonas gilva]|uniref:CPXCG motif-containing cysteine-rich protein n=1 Tax=Alteromonas gilva TaxID=2987522 RepID=A0ABT5KYN6_9ALTE|nr:hypothetical protein [Alteromonas gilva]MDC8829894.1 hypothetical protein [Alteromonas gilva]
MQSQSLLEYRCPCCGSINTLAKESVIDMYKEQLESCKQCHKRLEIIAATGINDQINLIVSELSDTIY